MQNSSIAKGNWLIRVNDNFGTVIVLVMELIKFIEDLLGTRRGPHDIIHSISCGLITTFYLYSRFPDTETEI